MRNHPSPSPHFILPVLLLLLLLRDHLIFSEPIPSSYTCPEGYTLEWHPDLGTFDADPHGDVCRKLGDINGNYECPGGEADCRWTGGKPPFCEQDGGAPCRVARGRKGSGGGGGTPSTKHSSATMEAKLLFKKPVDMTGQLELVDEGLDVIRSQKEPFAIVSSTKKACKSSLSWPYLRRLRCFVDSSAIDAHRLSSSHDDPHRY